MRNVYNYWEFTSFICTGQNKRDDVQGNTVFSKISRFLLPNVKPTKISKNPC